MRKISLLGVALGGALTIAASAFAAPLAVPNSATITVLRPSIEEAYYYRGAYYPYRWHGHYYHHRRWYGGHWHYW